MGSLLSRYPKHSLVSGHVTTVTGVGALVTLSDGVRGHIHARELAWANVDQPRRFVREGQQLDAVVIGEDPVRHVLLLSRRLAMRDPWPMIGETYPLHSTWEGRISQVTEHGAFIELEPVVVGLARPADLPQAEDDAQPLDLWPGDWVLVRVLTLDPHRHRIGLSVRAVIEERDQALASARFAGSAHGTTIGEQIGLRSDPLQAAQPPWRTPADSIHSILLVDDDHEFGANTADWLAGLGYETAHRASVAAAKEALTKQTFDLLLLDYDLGDGDGLSLAREVVAHNPQVQIVLLSGQAELQFCRRAALPQLTCWSKPFTMSDFAELLRQISEGSCRICQQRDQPVIAADLLRQHGLDRQTLAPLDVLCRSELHKLVAATEAQVGIVCTVDGGSQQVRVIAHEGAGLNYPRIIFTAHQPDTALELFQRYYGALPPGVWIYSKRGAEGIDVIVERAFRLAAQGGTGQVGINFDQRLFYARGLSSLYLVDLLQTRPPHDEGLLAWAREMEDLFGKAFPDRDALTLSPLSQGRGGGFVLIVTSQQADDAYRPLVVKCADRTMVLDEYERYRKHVKEFLTWVAHVDDEPIEVLHMGLLKYRVAGGNVEDTLKFSDFYRRYEPPLLIKAIEHLFRKVADPWYRPIGAPRTQENIHRFYEQRLLVRSNDDFAERPSLWLQVRQAIDAILATTSAGITIERRDERLHWRFGPHMLNLPDPFLFLNRLREQPTLLFPRAYAACRCHGDLHAENILVDDEAHVWLIDFAHTEWGPVLHDATELEGAIHFTLVEERRLDRLLAFEAALGAQQDFGTAPPLPEEFAHPDYAGLRKATDVILALRHEAQGVDGARFADYLLGLIYQALRLIRRERPLSLSDGRRLALQKVQALFLAAICCERLQELERDSLTV
jgi:CheY-like chemotaxis protein/predicted RNA-binding protein with RPS1 domain